MLEVLKLVIQKTKAAGISLKKLPLATPQDEDDPHEPKAGESAEEAPLAPQQEEDESVDWGSPLASESDVGEELETEVVTVSHSEAWLAPASQISAQASSFESRLLHHVLETRFPRGCEI